MLVGANLYVSLNASLNAFLNASLNDYRVASQLKTDKIVKLLGQETDIMGKRIFMHPFQPYFCSVLIAVFLQICRGLILFVFRL